jgi:arylformamidase
VECFGLPDFPAHHALLGAGIPIVEGLDISGAQPG